MRIRYSCHFNDTIRLSVKDIILLLCGRIIGKGTSIRIGLWRMPKNYFEKQGKE